MTRVEEIKKEIAEKRKLIEILEDENLHDEAEKNYNEITALIQKITIIKRNEIKK